MASIFWDNQGVIMVDYLEEDQNDKWCILCRRTEAAASGDCEEKVRKDSRPSALAG